MIKRRYLLQFSLMLTLLFSMATQSAMALSLGEINVRSHFAEPFLANISLPSYSADEIEGIEIQIASPSQHLKMGYEPAQTSKKFRFSIEEDSNGKLYIEIRSESQIKELSISLLLEVTTVTGRIIKGYDILLSPEAITTGTAKTHPSLHKPTDKHDHPEKTKAISSEKKAGTKTPVTNAPDTSAIVEKKIPSPNDRSKVFALKDGGYEYRNIASGESLSRIAQRIRPDKSMHMYQVMIALYDENPNSFQNGNINKLLEGSNLKLVDIDKIKAISASKAFQLIQRAGQNKSTRQNADIAQSQILEPETLAIVQNAATNQNKTININQVLSDVSNINNDLTNGLTNETLGAIDDERVLAAAMPNNAETAPSVANQLKKAKTLISDLDAENQNLRERIASLELQISSGSKTLFSPQAANQAPQEQIKSQENTPVSVTQMGEKPSFIAEYQTAISITGAGLLAIALIAMRKKKEILQLIKG